MYSVAIDNRVVANGDRARMLTIYRANAGLHWKLALLRNGEEVMTDWRQASASQ